MEKEGLIEYFKENGETYDIIFGGLNGKSQNL